MRTHAPGCEPAPRARSRAAAGGAGQARAVTTLVRKLVAAWNRGDAEAFGAAFARSATYLTGAGRLVRGRAAIADLVRPSGGNVRIVGPIEVYRRTAGCGARFRWSSPGPRGSTRRGVIACALTRDRATWLIRRLANEEHGDA